MRSKLLWRLCLWAVVSAAFISPLHAQDKVPSWPLKNDSSSVVRKKLTNRIKYWLIKIRDAKKQEDIITARKKLISEFGYADSPKVGLGYEFAQITAKYVPALLNRWLPKDDPPAIRRIKEVNIALAVSRMNQKTILPALVALVKFPNNPAVRYHGWRGYRNVRTRLLGQGERVSSEMFTALAEASLSETSPAVLSGLFGALQLDSIRPTQITAEMWQYASDESFKVLSKGWPKWCQSTVNGDAEMSMASRRAISAVMQIARMNLADKEKLAAPMQLIADMARCSAVAYDNALTEATDFQDARGESKLVSPAEQTANEIVNSNAALLFDCEKSFNILTGVKIESIQKALSSGDATEVRSAVSRRIAQLKPYGIKRKYFRPKTKNNSPLDVDAAKDAE